MKSHYKLKKQVLNSRNPMLAVLDHAVFLRSV